MLQNLSDKLISSELLPSSKPKDPWHRWLRRNKMFQKQCTWKKKRKSKWKGCLNLNSWFFTGFSIIHSFLHQAARGLGAAREQMRKPRLRYLRASLGFWTLWLEGSPELPPLPNTEWHLKMPLSDSEARFNTSNYGPTPAVVLEKTWESPGLQGDQTSQS